MDGPKFRIMSSTSDYIFREQVDMGTLIQFIHINRDEMLALYTCEIKQIFNFSLRHDKTSNVRVMRLE